MPVSKTRTKHVSAKARRPVAVADGPLTEAKSTGNQDDQVYHDWLQRIQQRFDRLVAEGRPLFTTSVTQLFKTYLDAFPAAQRQEHNCNACHHFIKHYGGLLTISEDGVAISAIWNANDAPVAARPVVREMLRVIRGASITGVFLTDVPQWGHRQTGPWRHFSLNPPPALVLGPDRLTTPFQKMAAKRENFRTVRTALQRYTLPLLKQAVNLLETGDAMYRAEKVIGPARWLLDVKQRMQAAQMPDNVLWLAVARAPEGFCHPAASMVGTLLEDLADGLPLERCKDRFNEKMHPAKYMRPVAPPSVGNLQQASSKIQKLGLEDAILSRRPALLTDDGIVYLWRPNGTTYKRETLTTGVSELFRHLVPANTSRSIAATPVQGGPITAHKFITKVLPEARYIAVFAPSHGPYAALLTGNLPDNGERLLQWDHSFSIYTYTTGSPASRWEMVAGQWVTCLGIVRSPKHWLTGATVELDTALLFIMDGARDPEVQTLCLFPEMIRGDLHGERAAIEALSNSRTMSGRDARGWAAGLLFAKSQRRVRVTTDIGITEYEIDRWD